jgi:hypothetical protein
LLRLDYRLWLHHRLGRYSHRLAAHYCRSSCGWLRWRTCVAPRLKADRCLRVGRRGAAGRWAADYCLLKGRAVVKAIAKHFVGVGSITSWAAFHVSLLTLSGWISNRKLDHVDFIRDYTINADKAKGKRETGAGKPGCYCGVSSLVRLLCQSDTRNELIIAREFSQNVVNESVPPDSPVTQFTDSS